MRKIAAFILSFCAICWTVHAQNALKSSDDLGRIALTPVLSSKATIPSYAAALVNNKLVQVVTQSGLGGSSLDQRFIITANIVEISREITSTAPPMVALGLSTTLYIGDVVTGNLFSSCSLPTVNGVGTNESRAYMSAVRTINVQTPEVAAFIETGKEKIIEYYNSQIDFIVADAEALKSKEQFDDAMSVLFSVPEVCKDAYLKAMDAVAGVFQAKIDKEGSVLLNTAKQVWNANQSYGGADEAASYLAKIHPFSSSFASANELSDSIARRVKEIDAREWNFRMKQYDDEQKMLNKKIDNAHDERMSMINAAREVGVARASQPITYNYNRITWW